VADIVDLVYADHDWLRRQFFYLDHATGQRRPQGCAGGAGDAVGPHAETEEKVSTRQWLRF